LHNALYALWGALESSAALAALDEDGAQSLVVDAACSAIESVPSALRQIAGPGCLKLEQQRLQGLLLEWLAIERKREPFQVVAREEPLEAEIAGLPLRLRVDRVDELVGGQRLVIDYKSGKNSLGDWLGARPAQPQLPLYSIVTDVSALAFAEVRSRECRLQGMGEVEGVPGIKSDIDKAVRRYSQAQDWASLQAEWHANLESLAVAFLQGDATVEPLARACTYCGLQSLCRVELAPGEVT
jgi:RecB family exonuclease